MTCGVSPIARAVISRFKCRRRTVWVSLLNYVYLHYARHPVGSLSQKPLQLPLSTLTLLRSKVAVVCTTKTKSKPVRRESKAKYQSRTTTVHVSNYILLGPSATISNDTQQQHKKNKFIKTTKMWTNLPPCSMFFCVAWQNNPCQFRRLWPPSWEVVIAIFTEDDKWWNWRNA